MEGETNETQPSAVQEELKRKTSYGPLITLVIVLVVIVVGALYAWGERIAEEEHLMTPEEGAKLESKVE